MKKTCKTYLSQLPPVRRSLCSKLRSTTVALLSLTVFGWQADLQAQSENFDSGALNSPWQTAQFLSQPVSFPDTGYGKGMRIQAQPVPGQAPAALLIAQPNVITDFYVAVDIVDWADLDQALVLFGRWTPAGAAGLAEATGYILNFDVLQDGDKAGDRQGGQLQINAVYPGFATATAAAAELTFVHGHSYRLIFQGTDNLMKGEAYDLADLTKPLVTLYFQDLEQTYPSGLSGFLSFSRDGSTGVTDVTIDNLLATTSDPNAASAPAIAHPVPGVPVVTERVPEDRWANFHDPLAGISFTAKTFTAGEINASATKLYLNGADASASLAPLPANGSTVSFSTAPNTLEANTLYEARIELTDTTGNLKSTNTFWFDTFSDAYVASQKTIEAEDYNYSTDLVSGGQYQLDPIDVSGIDYDEVAVGGNSAYGGNDKGYFNFQGIEGIDYVKTAGFMNTVFAEYRPQDKVMITQGSTTTASRDEAGDVQDFYTNTPPHRIHSTQRAKYTAARVWEYQVKLTSPGDWMNYTRSFTPTNYHVYLRCSSFGATTVYLDQVTSDPTHGGQSTVRHGAFNVGNNMMRLNYKYVPLMVGNTPAVVSLSGLKTLRLTMGGTPIKDQRVVNLDYLLLVPTSDGPTVVYPSMPPTVFDNFNDGNDTNPAWLHYDPIFETAGDPFLASSFITTGGVYHLITPAQPFDYYGPSRAGSFLSGVEYSDFYASVDLLDFDDTVRQAFGIAARISTPGLGTMNGYLFSWEPGGGILPGEDNGDLDISWLEGENPMGQLETDSSEFHLERGKQYRLVFIGKGADFEGRVYEFPDLNTPVKTIHANDPGSHYSSGLVGLIVAGNDGANPVPGDATFDNFLVTTAEPRIDLTQSGDSITLSWPFIPYRLESSPSLSAPVWTEINTGISSAGGVYEYTIPATGSQFFRLVYP